MTDYYKKTREFAEKHVAPYAKDIDEKKRFPEESFKSLGEEGYLSLVIPKEYGGEGLTISEHTDICRALAKDCASVGLCYMMHNVALRSIVNYGSEELKRKVFKDVIENKKFLALAYSEFGTGTHFYFSETQAEFTEEKVVLNGRKSMITSGGYASYYVTNAPSELNQPGVTDVWLIPIETEGVSFETSLWDGLGMRGNVSAPMNLKNVTLGKEWRLGDPGYGARDGFGEAEDYFILGLGAIYSGVSESVLKEAIEHAINRKYPVGETLAHIETVQIHLSRIYGQTNAAVNFVKEAARACIEKEEDAFVKVLSARAFASEAAVETARIGMRIGGGKAYNKQGIMERLLRDSYAGQVMAPSVDVLHVWTGKLLGGIELF